MTDREANLLAPGDDSNGLRRANERRLLEIIRSSPRLREQVANAVASGGLEAMYVSDRPGTMNMAAFYEPGSHSIDVDVSMARFESRGTLAFIVGHELRHAENNTWMAGTIERFTASVRLAAMTDCDYSTATTELLGATRTDEATANTAGWNTFVSVLHAGRSGAALEELARSEISDTVLERPSAGPPRFIDGYVPNRDGTLGETPQNIETMAQQFYDRPGASTGQGLNGDSDYLHFYAAWAIGHIGEVHVAYQPYRDEMRRRQGHNPRAVGPSGLDPLALPFEDLAIDTGQLHRTGIDFGGTQHIPFLDTGMTRTGFLTATDPKRLPPTPLPRPVLDSRELITAPTLDERSTPRNTTLAAGRRNTQATSIESATTRARRTTTPHCVARTGTTTRTPRGHDR